MEFGNASVCETLFHVFAATCAMHQRGNEVAKTIASPNRVWERGASSVAASEGRCNGPSGLGLVSQTYVAEGSRPSPGERSIHISILKHAQGTAVKTAAAL